MITSLFKVYGDNELARQTFTDWGKAVAWAAENCKDFSIFNMKLVDGQIETSLNGWDYGVSIEKDDNNDNLVYFRDELLGRFPEKSRRKTVLCAIEKMLAVQAEEEARYALRDEFDGPEEGPHGGAFVDEFDYARHVGIDLQY